MEDTPLLYSQAYQAFSVGDKQKAESLLDEVVKYYPFYEPGWILLSKVTRNPEKVEKCVQNVLAIRLENLTANRRSTRNSEDEPRRAGDDSAALLLFVMGIIIFFVLQANSNSNSFIFSLIQLVVLGDLLSYSDIKKIIRISRTPIVTIAALPDGGRVEIMGNVQGEPVLISPISETACVFWHVETRVKKKTSSSGYYWETVDQGSSDKPFLIGDNTGTIKILPKQRDLFLKNHLKGGNIHEFLIEPNQQIFMQAEIQEPGGEKSLEERIMPLWISDSNHRRIITQLVRRVVKKILLVLLIGGLIIIVFLGVHSQG